MTHTVLYIDMDVQKNKKAGPLLNPASVRAPGNLTAAPLSVSCIRGKMHLGTL
ncbi:MAG: hypothetical protein JRH15_12515 [Deltaproteobacteria bacterium]|nr:hypothetical protein [Deltaproteobacteria bacterium]